MAGLDELERRVCDDLACLNHPPANWVRERPGSDADVVIVGAGMCGLAAGFALQRRGITRVRILDRAPPDREGPWLTYARMRTLRSPKHLAGPAMGIASLTFRAWFRAQWGDAAWESLGRIPRTTWAAYLAWFRRVLDLPVTHRVAIRAVVPDDDGVSLVLDDADGARRLRARNIVLATGREGIARPRVPPALAGLDPARCRHSSEAIDYAALAGRRVLVIGLGASAFDNAGEALEAGAAAVHLVGRAEAMPRINKAKQIVYAGFTEGFPALPDADRLRLLDYIFRCRVAPPRDSVLRVTADPRFRLHLDAGVRSAGHDGEGIRVDTGAGVLTVDAVVCATGFRIDLGGAPEIAAFAARVETFRHRLGAHAPGGEFLDFPALGPGFEFRALDPRDARALGHVHCFNFAATASHGNVSGDIPAVGDGAERLARAIARNLFLDDAAGHAQDLRDYVEPELVGDEAALDAWWPPIETAR